MDLEEVIRLDIEIEKYINRDNSFYADKLIKRRDFLLRKLNLCTCCRKQIKR